MSDNLGKFRAIVFDIDDPDKSGRVRLKIPSVLGDTPSNWAIPVCPYYANDGVGTWGLPDIGDTVWVEFEEGHIDRPLLVGSWWSERKTPIKEYNEADYKGKPYKDQLKRRRIKTKAGHMIELNDIGGDLRILIEDSSGSSIIFDSEKGDINIKASNEVNIKGSKINLN